jgi:TonB family protein
MMKRIISAIFLLLMMTPAHAEDADLSGSFREILKTFNELVDHRQYSQAVPYGELAIEMSAKLNGANGVETIILTYTLANCHQLSDNSAKAIEVARTALAKAEVAGLGDNLLAVPALMVLGRAYGSDEGFEGRDALLRALRILEKAYGKNDPNLGNVLRELGNNLIVSRTPLHARRYYERSVDVTEGAPPQFDDAHALSLFELGRYEMAVRNNRKAEKRFLEVIQARAGKSPGDHLEVAARRFLIELYDRLDEPEKATAHVHYLTSLEPEEDQAEMKPLFKLVPEYPEDALRAGKEGEVIMEATIDETGRVVDPRVTRATLPGVFDKVALESVRRWRYKPRVVNGRYVAREKVPLRVIFTIRRRP